MAAARYNIIIDQHADFTRSMRITIADEAVDITDYEFTAQIRTRTQSDTATDFVCSITNALEGTFQFSLTDVQTAALSPGEYVWDLLMIDPTGTKTRLLQGRADVEAGVTR